MESDYHTGAQDGYKAGYNQALVDVAEMIRDNFPDPNPLASIFETYLGDDIIESVEDMKKG